MKKRIYKFLKKNNASLQLLINVKEKKFKDFISGQSSWMIIIVILAIVYVICYLYSYFFYRYFLFLNLINLDFSLSLQLIDLRTSNIITFISISFIVIGLLINNIKEKNKITYDIILKNINLYPTMYFSFLIIIVLLIQSTFRQNLDPYFFQNCSIINIVMIVIVLIFILILFYNVIKCIDIAYLNNLFTQELKFQAEYQLLTDLIQLKSLNIYRKSLLEIGLDEYNYFNAKHHKLQIKNKGFLKDIDLNRLIKLVKTCKIKGLFYPLFLGQYFSLNLNVFEFDKKLSKSTKQKIRKTFKMSKKSFIGLKYIDYYELIIDRLMQSVENSDNTKLNNVLENLEMLQEIYFKYEPYLNEAKI